MNKQTINQEIDQQWSTLKKLATSIINNPVVADDVLQIAFVKALTTKSLPRHQSKILPWLKTIIKNTALDVLRKQKHIKKQEIETNIEQTLQNEKFEASTCKCVLKLLSHLSKEDQKLLIELDIKNIPIQKISDSMSVSKSTLKVRRYRARQRLKKILIKVCLIGSSEECSNCDCQ